MLEKAKPDVILFSLSASFDGSVSTHASHIKRNLWHQFALVGVFAYIGHVVIDKQSSTSARLRPPHRNVATFCCKNKKHKLHTEHRATPGQKIFEQNTWTTRLHGESFLNALQILPKIRSCNVNKKWLHFQFPAVWYMQERRPPLCFASQFLQSWCIR